MGDGAAIVKDAIVGPGQVLGSVVVQILLHVRQSGKRGCVGGPGMIGKAARVFR